MPALPTSQSTHIGPHDHARRRVSVVHVLHIQLRRPNTDCPQQTASACAVLPGDAASASISPASRSTASDVIEFAADGQQYRILM